LLRSLGLEETTRFVTEEDMLYSMEGLGTLDGGGVNDPLIEL